MGRRPDSSETAAKVKVKGVVALFGLPVSQIQRPEQCVHTEEEAAGEEAVPNATGLDQTADVN